MRYMYLLLIGFVFVGCSSKQNIAHLPVEEDSKHATIYFLPDNDAMGGIVWQIKKEEAIRLGITGVRPWDYSNRYGFIIKAEEGNYTFRTQFLKFGGTNINAKNGDLIGLRYSRKLDFMTVLGLLTNPLYTTLIQEAELIPIYGKTAILEALNKIQKNITMEKNETIIKP